MEPNLRTLVKRQRSPRKSRGNFGLVKCRDGGEVSRTPFLLKKGMKGGGKEKLGHQESDPVESRRGPRFSVGNKWVFIN